MTCNRLSECYRVEFSLTALCQSRLTQRLALKRALRLHGPKSMRNDGGISILGLFRLQSKHAWSTAGLRGSNSATH